MTIPWYANGVTRTGRLTGAILCGGFPIGAHAMTGPMVDTAADYLAIFAIIVVPIAGIYVFWKLHILPEKIAEKRHHPQKDAIRTLCILSLFFGGLLWPIAWLWAYTKPTLYKLAYGTDKHEDYYKAMRETSAPNPSTEDLARLRISIAQLSEKIVTDAANLETLRKELTRLESAPTPAQGQETT